MVVFTHKEALLSYQINVVTLDNTYQLVDIYWNINDTTLYALFQRFTDKDTGISKDFSIYINTIGSSLDGRHDYIGECNIYYKSIDIIYPQYENLLLNGVAGQNTRVLVAQHIDTQVVYVNRLM